MSTTKLLRRRSTILNFTNNTKDFFINENSKTKFTSIVKSLNQVDKFKTDQPLTQLERTQSSLKEETFLNLTYENSSFEFRHIMDE